MKLPFISRSPIHMTRSNTTLAAATLAIMAISPAIAQDDLAEYFGFDGLEVIKVGRSAGPMAVGDINDDGLNDIVIANNFKSRIEIHYQKSNATEEDTPTRTLRTNEFPEHWRFRRENVTVSHAIGAMTIHDYDNDGLNDIIYLGQPSEIALLRQRQPGVFEVDRTHRVRGLNGNKDALAIADVVGDEAMELLAIAEGEIGIWSINDGSLRKEETLAAGSNMVAFWTEDFDGNGRTDVVAAIPDDSAPVRLWLAEDENGRGVIGPQIRFEMPPVVEVASVRLPDRPAAHLAIIERPSKRVVIYEISKEPVEETGDRDAAMQVYSFTDASNRDRDVSLVDINNDGMLDLIATDTESNAVVVYQQLQGKGLQRGESHASLAELSAVAAANVDDDAEAEVFVLSEEESIVGRSDLGETGLSYPAPISIPDGLTPVAMNLVTIDAQPKLTVVLKDGRKYQLAIVNMDGETEMIDLGSGTRSPDAIVGLDADQNNRTDLLLLTRDKPMTMLERTDDGFEVRESKDMGQFGLVQAATDANTSVFDIDGDGKEELLIANRNFVRAVRYEPNPPTGISAGWQVVKQINATDPDSELVAVTVTANRIIAADKENDRLLIFAEDDNATGGWRQTESVQVAGLELEEIFAGAFSGDGEENILAVAADGFAVIRLSGERVALRETNSWRTDDELRRQHELTAGDVNSDGFTDIVSLDAGEQMLEIFTFSAAGNMLYATGFQTFESRIFSGGATREFEPSQSIIADVTGDEADDIILLAHDRILLYPQMTEAMKETKESGTAADE